jgi:hypothetical protein
MGRQNTSRVQHVRIGVALLIPVFLALTIGLCSGGKAQEHDLSLTRLSDHGQFRVEIASDAVPIPMRRIHSWRVHVSNASGQPISGATLGIGGGMPEHHHGLPTQPQASAGPTAGDYAINGVRFSMTGWWVLNLAISTPTGRSDTVTFNLVL